MKKLFAGFLVSFFCFILSGQTGKISISGQVSFVSTQNIYVKFKSTDGITVGDTLFSQREGRLIPALIVRNLSTTSCVCAPLSSTGFDCRILLLQG
ncbi:MAG: hypothetical protein IPH69_08670 [Bacteroidales bacterium]|nr:hypothetical protein [Bacteroidales bacterium]